jgi:adenosylcobinamide-GDP ribazoletransferase
MSSNGAAEAEVVIVITLAQKPAHPAPGTYNGSSTRGEGSGMARGRHTTGTRAREALKTALSDLLRCMRFYSRLPTPVLRWETDPHGVPNFRTMPRMLPLAGAVIGATGAAAMVAALSLGLGPLLSAVLTISTLTLVTGAFHEDGLADAADGLGGGATPGKRLEIMRDSRIGSYGGAALIIAFALRVAALTTMAERLSAAAVAIAIVIAACVSRVAALFLFGLTAPARADGAAYAVGQPSSATIAIASMLAIGIAVALGLAGGLPLSGILLGLTLDLCIALAAARIASRLVGGHTGDIAGGTQQIAEIGFLVALLIAVPAVTR